MLVSEKIKKIIKAEIKSQENFLKVLNSQEKNYGLQLSKEKETTQNSIDYYKKFLEEDK